MVVIRVTLARVDMPLADDRVVYCRRDQSVNAERKQEVAETEVSSGKLHTVPVGLLLQRATSKLSMSSLQPRCPPPSTTMSGHPSC